MTVRTLESHLACLIGGVCFGALIMWQAGQSRHIRAELKGAQTVIAHEREASAVTAQVGAEVAARTDRIHYQTREVIRYVPQILTPEIDRRYPLPHGAVRLYDASIGVSGLADPAGQPDDAASGLATSDAFAVIAANNGECLAWREQLTGWQQWWAQQQAVREGDAK